MTKSTKQTKVSLKMNDLRELRDYINLIIPSLRGNQRIEWSNLHAVVANMINPKIEVIELNPFDKVYTYWSSMKWIKTQNISDE